jgi:hypothetical protein
MPTTAGSPRSTAEFRRNRKALLVGPGQCHWCGKDLAPGKGHADHLVEVVKGGDSSLANLVRSCPPCNLRRGSVVGNQRKRNGARRSSPSSARGFGSATRSTPQPSARRSAQKHPVASATTAHDSDALDLGRIEPRLVTPAVGSESYGPDVARWMGEHLPHEAMAWNVVALSGLLATDHGRLCHRHGLITVARQNSKTTMAEGLAGWWITDHADALGVGQVAAWCSHDLKLASIVFERLAEVLAPRVVKASHSHGRQYVKLDNGSFLYVVANSPGAGHGLTVNLAIVDECWRVSTDCVDHGLGPTMRAAKPEALMVLLSTAGDEDSHLFKRWRERGLAIIDSGQPGSLYFAEWSPPPGVDLLQPRWWRYANPALGVTIDLPTLQAEADGPNRSAFLRASLNVWVSSEAGWLEPGVWERCRSSSPRGEFDRGSPSPRGESDPPSGVVACEVSHSGERYVAVQAVMQNGVAHVRTAILADDATTFWQALTRISVSVEHIALTPSLEIHCPPALRQKVAVVGLRELSRWTTTVRGMILAGQVGHDGGVLLSEHVNRAVASRTDGGYALSTARSPGPIELARSMIWAVALAARPTWRHKPAIGVSA